MAAGIVASCTKFLDKSPDMGVTEEQIYRDYTSVTNYLDNCFEWLEQTLVSHYRGSGRVHPGALSDEFASLDRDNTAQFGNLGNWLLLTRTDRWEFGVNSPAPSRLAVQGVRVASEVINNIERVGGLTTDQRNEVLGQAHFYRAWYYFQLMKRYGGMPIFDQAFVGDGDQNKPRVTYRESHDWMLGDLNNACTMLPDNWDEKNTGRPTKAAALALRAMTQLYAASPLMQNNLQSTTVKEYDRDAAAQAAKYAWEALEHLAGNGKYRLMDASEYKNIFYMSRDLATQPEYIWYNRKYINDGGNTNHPKRTIRTLWLPSQAASGDIQNKDGDASSYQAPTQNMVDMFDVKGSDGIYYPIDHPNAGYDPVNTPFKDRDPRFYNNIIVPGEHFGSLANGNPYYFPLYEGSREPEEIKTNVYISARQMTGYVCKKFIWPEALNFGNPGPATAGWVMNKYLTVFIRYAQVYLDFAEASFEATGSATTRVDGCGMSALEAVNIVRARVGVTPLPADIVSDPTAFRAAYRRERAVELMFENHRWWDIRRWMVAHTMFSPSVVDPIRGMQAHPPVGHASVADKSTLQFTYTYRNLDRETRNFTMRNYWYPFTIADASSVPDFVQNPEW
jgi:hypothetical protein